MRHPQTHNPQNSSGPLFPLSENPLINAKASLPDFQVALTQVLQHPQPQAIAALTEVLDQYLQGKWDERTEPGKRTETLRALHKILGQRGQGNLAMAQINPALGDVRSNGLKVWKYMQTAEAAGVDTLIFPELTLVGYPIRDVIGRHPNLVEDNIVWLKELAKKSGKTRVLVGFVEPREINPADAKKGRALVGRQFYNSIAILGNGKIEGVIRKSLLPNYGEFNDWRQFEAAPNTGLSPASTLGNAPSKAQLASQHASQNGLPAKIHGKDYGIFICEDGWNDPDFFERTLYPGDPVADIAKHRPDFLINCSASPSRSRKEQLKHNMLSHMSAKYAIPNVYVNQVGAVDEHSYDGASRVYNAKGELLARAKSFEEQFLIVNPNATSGVAYPLAPGLEKTLKASKTFNPYDETDLGRTYLAVVQGIRDYFAKTGQKRAVLGLSGGLDSTISAVLLADALGPENVLGVSMPYKKMTTSESQSDAEILAKQLGIGFIEVPITDAVDTFQAGLSNATAQMATNTQWGSPTTGKDNTVPNFQARSRAMILWGIANRFPGVIPIATSDKSEAYVGYATINGDMSGGFAPIADIVKTKLFTLGHWMNANRPVKNAIPEQILKKRPGAELEIDPKTGKPLAAEDDLMPYEFMDEIIWRIENKGEGLSQMLKSPFWYEKQRQAISAEQKLAWLEKFYNRMNFAIFKWNLLPVSVIVDARSILKADYMVPTTVRLPRASASVKAVQADLTAAELENPVSVSTKKARKKPIKLS
ncbi:MAG: NAD(+) synthase [Cyanobacteria bacterium]|nr:NAD(+) synthase [Cyanobacteriota bacterium]